MNYRKELNNLIETYVDEYYGSDRAMVAWLYIRVYQHIGKLYNINLNKESKKLGINKIAYLERTGKIQEAYEYGKKITSNGKAYWDRKREEEDKKKYALEKEET